MLFDGNISYRETNMQILYGLAYVVTATGDILDLNRFDQSLAQHDSHVAINLTVVHFSKFGGRTVVQMLAVAI